MKPRKSFWLGHLLALTNLLATWNSVVSSKPVSKHLVAVMCAESSLKIAWGGALFKSDSNKPWGSNMGPLFESPPRRLLKSGLQPLAGYGTHQETICRRPEQMYTPSDTRLGWPVEGPLFESDSKCTPGAIIKVMHEALGKIWHPPGDHE